MDMALPTPSLPLDPPLPRPLPSTIKGNIVELPRQLKTPSPVTNATALPCQRHEANLWFSSVPAELNLAKAYCRGCRDRQSCLAGALERSEPLGVWGGEIFEHGHIIAFKRPRGRPRKSPCRDDQR